MRTHTTALTLTLLAAALAGCSTAAPLTPPVSQGTITAPASPPIDTGAVCVTPQENLKLGTYVSIFNGKDDPNAIRLAPGFTAPIRQADGGYTMFIVMPGHADGIRATVESETWEFAPNSGAMRPDPDTLIYEFAITPKGGTPRPGTITIKFQVLPNGPQVDPVTLRVFGPNEKLPACDVPSAYPAPSAVPKK